MQAKPYYSFYIVFKDENGEKHQITWNRLTEFQAKQMYKATDQSQPDNVFACGWERAQKEVAIYG